MACASSTVSAKVPPPSTVEHRQPVDNNEVVADAFAHRTHYFYGKSHPVAVIAAPLVTTLIGAQRQKFVDQIPFGPHYLYTVVSCLPCQLRAVGEIVDQLQDLFMREFVRNETVDGACNAEERPDAVGSCSARYAKFAGLFCRLPDVPLR